MGTRHSWKEWYYVSSIFIYQSISGSDWYDSKCIALIILLHRLLLTDDDRCSRSYLVFCSCLLSDYWQFSSILKAVHLESHGQTIKHFVLLDVKWGDDNAKHIPPECYLSVLWPQKMKIDCFRQTCPWQTNRRTLAFFVLLEPKMYLSKSCFFHINKIVSKH